MSDDTTRSQIAVIARAARPADAGGLLALRRAAFG
jgi:hypothetical protein